MNTTFAIIKQENRFGIREKLNAEGRSTAEVVETGFATLAEAGEALLERLRENELHVEDGSYWVNLQRDEFDRFPVREFTVGEDYCEVYELDCVFIIAEVKP